MSYTDDDLEKGLRPATSSAADQGQVRSPGPSSSLPDRPPSSSQNSPPLRVPSSSPVPSPPLPLPQTDVLPPPAASELYTQQQLQQHSTPGNPQQVAPAFPNVTAQEAKQEAQDSYIDPSDKLWSLYLKEADKEDEYLVESWKGDTEGILIFTGLFAATVATFVTQTYQLLIPSSEDASAAIQLQMSHQLAGLSNGTYIPAYVPPPFEVPFYAVWVNTLWFLSLFLSLTGALMATLMQQWTRRYLRGIRYRSTPNIRGPIRVVLRLGVKKYRMKQAVTLITSIIHASVFIFFAGLVGFAFSFNLTVANVLIAFTSALVAIYISLSVFPLFSTFAPYDTVLTPALEATSRLVNIPLMLAYKRGQKIIHFLRHRGQNKGQKPLKDVHDPEKRYFRSREQSLMQVVRSDGYLTTRHAAHILDRVLTNADEMHEVESFLDSMAVLLSDASTRNPWQSDGDSGDRFYHQSLVDSQTLGVVFRRYLLNRKIYSLVQSCDDSSGNRASPSTRIKRLRTVVMFISHVRMRKIPHDTKMIIDRLRYYGGQLLHSLSRDPDPSVAFISRLTLIGHCQSAESYRDGRGRRYYLNHVQPVADSWYADSEDTNLVAWPLFYFVELVCTILKYAISGGVDGPVAAYRDLWKPMVDDGKDEAKGDLWCNLRENGELIVEPVPRALLKAAGLEDLVYPLYLFLARQPPTEEEQLKIDRAFSTYPELADALREVAETRSLIPLYEPPLQPNLELEDSTVRRRPAVASISTAAGVGWVLFGPLTWRNRPAEEYQHLMHAWKWGYDFTNLIDDACEVLRDHPRGDGYARICFKKKEDARRFVDEWTRHRPPAYRVVTAEILDDDQDSTSGDSA